MYDMCYQEPMSECGANNEPISNDRSAHFSIAERLSRIVIRIRWTAAMKQWDKDSNHIPIQFLCVSPS